MSNNSRLRRGFLSTISIGFALVTVYAIANPHVGNRRVADFVFPEEIPLTNWQALSSESLAITAQPDENGEVIKAAKRYFYQQDDLNLVLEIRYLVGTRGNIPGLLPEYLEFDPAIMTTQKVKKISQVGSYLLVQENTSDQQLGNINHLSSCLTSLGYSIAEQKEFSLLLNQVQLTPELFWDWLWGQDSLRDRRCLWIHLSLTNHKNKSDSNGDLQQVWLELHRWGKLNFPKLSKG
ncbi:hypothetical protein Xen7305DRAFT_00015530 [Xenococcus sp. PCC 7305]|uniref:cyanoexosortase A system-associated protein n=1 Tax=Xenococcus sp. PCC 7305 TaxID=102125 RepID=UPI0002ACBB45|nr:cyanoexosortase A system-associated protein [Xenococcus sp. PCC 7305]ELS01846.1 hypothetical protein Xen7305DRAFT_00015530 [Xenococcus sp. PCC 7305]